MNCYAGKEFIELLPTFLGPFYIKKKPVIGTYKHYAFFKGILL